MILGINKSSSSFHQNNAILNGSKVQSQPAKNAVSFRGLDSDAYEKNPNKESFIDKRINSVRVLLEDAILETQENEEMIYKKSRKVLDKTLKDNMINSGFMKELKEEYSKSKIKEEKIEIMSKANEYFVDKIIEQTYKKNISSTIIRLGEEISKKQSERKKIDDLCTSVAKSSSKKEFLEIVLSDMSEMKKYTHFLFEITNKRDDALKKLDMMNKENLEYFQDSLLKFSKEFQKEFDISQEIFLELMDKFQNDFPQFRDSSFMNPDDFNFNISLN